MAVIRLISGEHNPSYRVVHLVVGALEKALGCKLDVKDLISYTGVWDSTVCHVCKCPGCLPGGALRDDGTIDPAYAGVKPGTWKSYRDLPEERALLVGGEVA